MFFGYAVGIAIVSAVSALLLKLGAKLIVKKSVGFVAAFVISFISFLIAIFVQNLTMHKTEAVWAVAPGIVFFISCWLLNAQFLKYDNEKGEVNYGKTFVVTLFQCVTLFVALIILSMVFVSGLMFLGNQTR